MRTQIRTFLLTGLLFLGLATGAQAQDKYEFATVTKSGNAQLRISIEGKPLEIQKLPKDQVYYDNNYLYEYVRKLQEDGWEVFNSHEFVEGMGHNISFVLRRKKA